MKNLILTILLASSSFSEEKTYGYAYVDSVISIYDGDTFVAAMSKSWPAIVRDRISIRIDGIDCPEMRDPNDSLKNLARKAKEYAVEKLRSAKKVTLKDMKRDKYFRILAKVLVDGKSLGDSLIAVGLARPYNGKGPKPW